MKLLLTCLLAAPLLTHCAVVDPSGARPSSPNVSGSPAQSQDAYNLGHQKGFEDGRSGASRNPRRHAGAYPFSESDAFEIGYEKGYNEGIR